MNGRAIRIKYVLMHRFRQGRMRENSMHEFLFSRFKSHRDDDAVDQFRHFGPAMWASIGFPEFASKIVLTIS